MAAVDGRRLGDTLGFCHKYVCIPCLRDGRNANAIKYCAECEETLCSTCLSHHNKFPTMVGHQMTNVLDSQAGKKIRELPKQTCDKHGGKLVDLYCSLHDSVGCSDCVKISHSSCHGIKYISKTANGTHTQKELPEIERRLDDLLIRIDKVKQQKKDHQKHVKQEKYRLLKEIRILRKKINEKLDLMERSLVDDVEAKFMGTEQPTKECIATINNIKSSIQNRQTSLQDAKAINEAEIFVQVKTGYSDLQEKEGILRHISSDTGIRELSLLPSNYFQRFLACDITFGRISERVVAKWKTKVGDFNVRLRSDKMTCGITDVCVTSSGNVIISDSDNTRIKVLNRSFVLKDYLDLPDNPYCLCVVDNTHIAVTLHNHMKVQFVSQDPLQLGKSFSVGDRCRGIDCYEGELYVCCGGNREKGESVGHIEVFDKDGNLQRYLGGDLNWPIYIKVSERDGMIVSDFGKSSMIIVNPSDNFTTALTAKELCDPAGFCVLGDSQTCVAGCLSNNIILLSEDGHQLQELMKENDGIVRPWAVCFDNSRSLLIVALYNSDVIKVFKVAM